MIDRLEATVKRYEEITSELSKPEIVQDIKKMTELSKEQTRLTDTVELYTKYKQILSGIEEARELKAISDDLIKYCDECNIPKGIMPENHPEMITPLKSTGYYQKNEEEKTEEMKNN